jgi:tetratricopeptide (TPR) repeat protein
VAQASLASLYSETGESDKAIAHAVQAAVLRPEEHAYRAALLGILSRAGRTEDAGMVERGLIQAARADPRALSVLVGYYQQAERASDAEALLLDVREGSPDNLTAVRLLAGHYESRDRYGEAEALLRSALAAHGETPWILNWLGYLNADRGVRVEEALGLIDRALAKEPKNAGFLDSRGWALFRLERLAEAEEALREAVDQGGGPVVLDHLGDVLRARGAQDEAKQVWRRALDRSDTSAELKASLERKLAAPEEAAEDGSPPGT